MRKARGKHRFTVYREMGPLDKFQLKVVAVVATLQPLLTHEVCPSKPLLGRRRRGGNHEAIGNDRWKGTPVSSLPSRFPSAIHSFQGVRKRGGGMRWGRGGRGPLPDVPKTKFIHLLLWSTCASARGMFRLRADAVVESDAKQGARVIPNSSLCPKKNNVTVGESHHLRQRQWARAARQSCWAPGARAHLILRRHWASAVADCAVPLLCPLGLRTVPYKRDVRSGLYGSRYRTVVAPNGHSTGRTLYGPAPYSTGQKRVQTVRLRSYGSRDKLIVDGT